MPINLSYQPSAPLVGSAANLGGLGSYLKWRDEQQQQMDLQANSIAAQQQQQANQIAAQQQSQQQGLQFDAQREMFRSRQDQQNRQQEQQFRGAMGQQDFEQRQQLQQQAGMQDRENFDYKLSETAKQEINKLNEYRDRVNLDPGSNAAQKQQAMAEIDARMAGFNELPYPKQTPSQEELQQEFMATTIPDPSDQTGKRRLQKDQHGKYVPVEQAKDPQLEHQRKVEADAAKAEIDNQKQIADAKIKAEESDNKLYDDVYKMMTVKDEDSNQVTFPDPVKVAEYVFKKRQVMEAMQAMRAAGQQQPGASGTSAVGWEQPPQAPPANPGASGTSAVGWESPPQPAPPPQAPPLQPAPPVTSQPKPPDLTPGRVVTVMGQDGPTEARTMTLEQLKAAAPGTYVVEGHVVQKR